MFVDFTDQPNQVTNAALPAIAPPPPAPKPPTLASLLVARMEDIAAYTQSACSGLAKVEAWLIVAIALATLSVLLDIAVLVMLGVLLGLVR